MPILTAPSNPALTVLSTTSIKFTWQDNCWEEDSYHVYRSLDGTSYAQIVKLNPNKEEYIDTGLTPGTLYYYKVRCKAEPSSWSDYSAVVSATTASASDPVTLAAPTSVTTVPIQGTKVEVNFTNASVGEEFHCIERKAGSGSYSEIIQLATGTTYYLDTGLTAGTVYAYKIRDLQGTTYGAYSAESTATPPKPFAYIAYGTGTTDEGAALTALVSEVARAAATVEIVSTYTPNDTVRFSNEFTATGSASITEIGVFDASSGGNMLGRKLFSAVSVTINQVFLTQYDFAIKDGGAGG